MTFDIPLRVALRKNEAGFTVAKDRRPECAAHAHQIHRPCAVLVDGVESVKPGS
ncbi:hypothetical protein [Microbacterium lacticum]|uniref:hypothetical protein n=1 Tax=Microbacterium lacticum TaxID=33885 RepID=UPI0028D334B8|nr:hypothetical protein [Microbacterium lacticum]